MQSGRRCVRLNGYAYFVSWVSGLWSSGPKSVALQVRRKSSGCFQLLSVGP